MELYTLRLGAPLSWVPVTPPLPDADPDNAPTGIALPVLAQDGEEAIFIWTMDQLVAHSEDGPHLCRPLPLPLQTGISEKPGDATPETGKIVLPVGSYLFCQERLIDITSTGQTLEWFFRETWWTGAKCKGSVFLRLIREDGKTAVQVIMESAKEG